MLKLFQVSADEDMKSIAKMSNLKSLKAKHDAQLDVPIDIDKMIKGIQEPNIKHKNQRFIISEKQFITLCRLARNSLLRQPSLLRLNEPLIVASGTLGYFRDLSHIISRCGHPDMHNYLFLGNYTGKGPRNIECLVLLMCLKIRLANNFFLLRGRMECISMSRGYNLYEECLQRFSPKAWAEACEFMCSLPFAAVIEDQIFCSNGGISPHMRSLEDVNRITRPIDTPESGLACDIVWSQFSDSEGSVLWRKEEGQLSYQFNSKTVEKFCKEHLLVLVCRASEVAFNGFSYNRLKNLATICSLANYGGLNNNSAAVMIVNQQSQAYFKIIKEKEHFPMQTHSQDNAASMLRKVMEEKRERRKNQEKNKIEEAQVAVQSPPKDIVADPVVLPGQQEADFQQPVEEYDQRKLSLLAGIVEPSQLLAIRNQQLQSIARFSDEESDDSDRL